MTFPNGLRLISNTRGSFPLVAIDLWIRAGAREEKPGENGTAHFLEHAVFKGTTKRPDNGSDIAIENIGGVINAATGPDYVRFYATVPSKNLEEALEIFSDLMQNSLLSDAQIEKERGVVLDELSLRDADPQNALISRLYEKSFRGHPYFHAPGGEAAQMRIRARDTLAKFYLRFYSPERATIVISGDCSPESAKAAVGRSFGNWKSSSPPGEKQAFSQDVKEFVSGRSLMQGESERGGIGIGFPAPPARDGVACRSAEIVAAILGDSETGGRLATASLKSGIVRAQFTPRLDGSLLTITAIPKVTQNSDGTERKGSQEAEGDRSRAVGDLRPRRPQVASRKPSKTPGNSSRKAENPRQVDFQPGNKRRNRFRPRLFGDYWRGHTRRDPKTPLRHFRKRDRDLSIRLFSTGASNLRSAETERGATMRSLQASLLVVSAILLQIACAGQILPAKSRADADSSIRRVVLPGGTRAILKTEPESELVALTVCIRIEPDATTTEAVTGELVSRALFGSSRNRSREEILNSLARVGGSLETQKTPETVTITVLTLPDQVREAIGLVMDSLKNADFSQESLDRARKSLNETKRQREENGLLAAYSQLKQTLQGGLLDIDTEGGRLTTAQAELYYRTRYLPERTVVSIVGRFDLKSALSSLETNCLDYTRKPVRPADFKPVFRGVSPSAIPTLRQSGASGFALIACPSPSVGSSDYPAFLTLQALLGIGHASRLYRQTRELKGAGYGVGTFYNPLLSDPLMLYFQWEAKSASGEASLGAEDVIKLLNSQLDSLQKSPPDEAELRRAKSVAIGKAAILHERIKSRATLLAWYEAMGRGYDFDRTLPDEIEKVQLKDIQRVAVAYLKTRTSALGLPAK